MSRSNDLMGRLKQLFGNLSPTEEAAIDDMRRKDKRSLLSLARKLRGRNLKASLILMNAWIASSYFTFVGFMNAAKETATASFTGSVEALIYSIVAAVVVAGSSALLLGFAGAEEDRSKRTKKIMYLSAALAPFVVGISTINAVKGLSSAPAAYMEMTEKAPQWVEYARAELTDPSAALSVQRTIIPLRDSICGAADAELEHGLISGASGAGALSGSYFTICKSFTSITDTLQTSVEASDSRVDAFNALVDRLVAIPEQDDVSIFERRDQFEEAAVALETLVADGRSENLRKTVGAQIEIATNSVFALETQDGAFGNRQRAAIQSLKDQLSRAEGILLEFLSEEDDAADVARPEPLGSSEAAIAQYWQRLVPQILAAICVDLAVLWMAAFLAAGRASLRETEGEILAQPHWQDEPDFQTDTPTI